jgi:hypothetical protein
VQVINIQILFGATLRAMTRHKEESTVMLFVVIMQLLLLCGAIRIFVHHLALFCGAWIIHSLNDLLIAPLVDG